MRYYVYNRDDTSLTFLFAHKPALDDYELAMMEPFSFRARDGLTIHGYVTYPPAVEPAGLPAVVNVHGGPWYRDVWGYDPEAQWLANRGYACIQVNYRGSTGYGKAFGNAGDREWGRAMHTDLLDAVAHLVAEGRIDGGPSRHLRRVVRRIRRAGRSRIHSRGVSLRRGHGGAVEPHHADRVGAGVLEADDRVVPHQGRQSRDRARLSLGTLATVPGRQHHDPAAHRPREERPPGHVVEAEQIVAALTEKGIDHEYLLFEDEGHGLARPENRERFYAAVERFLAQHLGGRQQED